MTLLCPAFYRKALLTCFLAVGSIASLSAHASSATQRLLQSTAPLLEAPAPKISWVTPANTTLYPSPTVSVDVLAIPVGSTLPITKVQFYLNGSTTPLATLGTPVAGSPNTYRLTVDSSVFAPSNTQTTVSLVAEAINSAGKKRKTATQNLVIKPPVLRMTAPSNGSAYLLQNANTASVAVAMNPAAPFTSVDCLLNGVKTTSITVTSATTSLSCPFTFTQVGNNTLSARAINGTNTTPVASANPITLSGVAYTFTALSNQGLDTPVKSNLITTSGIPSSYGISMSGGQYSIDGGLWQSTPNTLRNGQSLQVRLNTATTANTAKAATLTIGSYTTAFNTSTATTAVLDATPNAYGFSSASNVPTNTLQASPIATITGLAGPAPITVNGGQYRIDGGDWQSTAGQIYNGQTLQIRTTSAATPSTTKTVWINIGGVGGSYSVSTAAANTTPANQTTQRTLYTFDALGRLQTIKTAAGEIIATYTYDANGNRKTSLDSNNIKTTVNYDSLNRSTTQTITDSSNATLQSTSQTYNSQDLIATAIDGKGITTSHTYNGFGDMTTEASPDTGTTTRTYTKAGQLNTLTTANNKTLQYTYDALGRSKTVRNTSSTADQILYTYGTAAPHYGRLTQSSVQSGTTSGNNHSSNYTYNVFGEPLTQTDTFAGNAAAALMTRHSYNTAGQRTQTITPAGRTVGYSYNTLGQIDSITTNGIALIPKIYYHAFGGLKRFNAMGNQSYTRSLDTNGRIASYTLAGNTQTIGYQSPANDLITQITPQGATTPSSSYQYDALERLKAWQTPSTANIQWTYDPNHNRTSQAQNTSVQQSVTLSPSSNRVSAFNTSAPQYNNAGSLTQDSSRKYSYNGLERISSIQNLGNTTLLTAAYNGFGQRHWKSSASGNTRYTYDENGQVTGEYTYGSFATANANLRPNQAQETLWLDNTPIAILDSTPTNPSPLGNNTNNGVRIIHTDHLNTPRTITSASAAILWQWQGDPFGNSQPTQAAVTPAISNAQIGATAQGYVYNQRFAGQTYDKETGLYYNYFRHYDPQTGRYVEADPIGLEGGWNRYAYVGGNPLEAVDPRGLSAKDVNLIVDTFMNSVAGMVKKGQRLDGGGGMVGALNNNVSAENGYGWMIWLRQELLQKPATLVCYQQWDVVENALLKNAYEDKWTFEMVETPGHYFGKATSNNPKDPDIYLDPWKNKVDMRYDKTSPDSGGSLLSKVFQ